MFTVSLHILPFGRILSSTCGHGMVAILSGCSLYIASIGEVRTGTPQIIYENSWENV